MYAPLQHRPWFLRVNRFLALICLTAGLSFGQSSFNLLFQKPAAQSSTFPGSPAADAAVDGNTNGNFSNGSVTATNPENNPWWQGDLQASVPIGSIVIWNRTDCCDNRLSDYWVFVSDTPFLATDTPSSLAGRPGTFSVHQTTAPGPSTTITLSATGRFVRVQLGSPDILSLAEVQAFSPSNDEVNVAMNKPASQSSTFPGTSGAAAAVDGYTNGIFYANSVTATNLQFAPWWQVDLLASAPITSIKIWNRTDCCGSRLGDYWVFISDTPFADADTPSILQSRGGTLSFHQTTAPAPSTTIQVGAQGRYVRVQLSGSEILSLAEVQVFTSLNPGPGNVALGRPASQSSILAGSPGAGTAVDGSTDGNYFHGSVSTTNSESTPWWQVDLQSSSTVASVRVWNRTDCCASRLADFWVFVSDSPFQASDTPSTLKSRPGTFAYHQLTPAGPVPQSLSVPVGAPGRYVRIQLNGTDYLSLAEVEVFGSSSSGGGGGSGGGNAAAGKPAGQSSTIAGTPSASAAVDGNTDGNFYASSVTATNLEVSPWWQVDLQASTSIGSVVVWNRTDCCVSRLNDYWVFVSDTPFAASDTPASLQGRAGTLAFHQSSAPSPSTTIGVGAKGRYVRVQLSGTGVLSLAEVQVIQGNDIPALSNGQSASGTLTQDQQALYRIAVPGGATQLQISTTGMGDNDLYVRYGAPPTLGVYDCRSNSPSGNETCTFSVPSSGDWYILVYGYGIASYTLTARYQ